MKYILIFILFSSCYSSKKSLERQEFVRCKIDIKQKYIEGRITKCEHDWLMLTYYEMYYGQ